ncbi:ADP-ribosylation factor-like protein 5B [Takifugu flavidus]|uniref:ADP-ribosylation factor-like protein 5B n=1 Tax=Takifugu flavidus TaxID=433684 RepID=A0A5C6NWA4_9TELE|nr:ADP-ribosylation factor-like protein 5B [Takifugu flavidus]
MGLIFAKLWSFFCNQGVNLHYCLLSLARCLTISHLLRLTAVFTCFAEHKVIIVGLDNAGKTTILYQFLMNEVVHTSPTIGSNVEEIVVKNTHFLMWDIGGQESLRSSWNTYYSNTEVGSTFSDFSFFALSGPGGGKKAGQIRHMMGTTGGTTIQFDTHLCLFLPEHDVGYLIQLEATIPFEKRSWVWFLSPALQFIILVVDSTDRERLAISKEELYRMLAHEDLRKAAVLIFANKQDMKNCMSAAEISTYLTLSSIKDHPWHIQSCCALTGEGLCQGLEWMTSRAGLR